MRTLFFLLLCSLQPSIVWADWTISTLMKELASNPHSAVKFTEIKTLGYLDVALSSKGVLSIDKQGLLTKETTSPKYERLIIDSETVRVLQAGRDEVTLSLSDYPIMRGFIEAFRATILGEMDLLSQYYQIEMTGKREAWMLHLRPLQARLGAVIKIIDIEGDGGMIDSFTIEEQSGDSTMMKITGY